jgi:DNA repair protein RadA/Sms
MVAADTVFFGELGLAGEIRSISQTLVRLKESQKLGFRQAVIPRNNHKNLDFKKGPLELIPVSTLKEALDIALRK